MRTVIILCGTRLTMSHFPVGSSIFRTVMAQMDLKYQKNTEPLQETAGVKSPTIVRTKHHDEHRRRVQWVDESRRSPLAMECRHCFRSKDKQDLKPILKYQNCLLF